MRGLPGIHLPVHMHGLALEFPDLPTIPHVQDGIPSGQPHGGTSTQVSAGHLSLFPSHHQGSSEILTFSLDCKI